MIPKIAHFVWIGSKPPSWVKLNIKSFRNLHPDYKIILHKGLPLNAPQSYYEAVCELPLLAMKADLIRYWVLYDIGGVYFDVDFEFKGRLTEQFMKHPWACMDGSNQINNAALGGAGSKDPIFKEIIDACFSVFHDSYDQRTSFGPSLLTAIGINAGLEVFDRSHFYLGDKSKIAKHRWGVKGSSMAKANKKIDNTISRIEQSTEEVEFFAESYSAKEQEYLMHIRPGIKLI